MKVSERAVPDNARNRKLTIGDKRRNLEGAILITATPFLAQNPTHRQHSSSAKLSCFLVRMLERVLWRKYHTPMRLRKRESAQLFPSTNLRNPSPFLLSFVTTTTNTYAKNNARRAPPISGLYKDALRRRRALSVLCGPAGQANATSLRTALKREQTTRSPQEKSSSRRRA